MHNVLAMIRRAVGADVLQHQVDASFTRLQQHMAALTSSVEAQLSLQIEILRDNVAKEIHRQVEHIDNRVSQHFEHFRQLQHQMIADNRFLQNPFFSRDTLPPAILVKQYYLELTSTKDAMAFDDIGFSIFSQNNEDGILLYIFSRIGMASRRSIEIGCDLSASTIGIPEGNTINLITNFAFDGLIIDIDAAKTGAIRHFFAQCLTTKHLHAPAHGDKPAHYFSPALITREVTPDNVNKIFDEAAFSGDIDLLSIDVDGADVSIWRAVNIVNPRVVVIEINARLPMDVIVYGQASRSEAPKDSLTYQASASSSLAAACQVAEEKGYEFVGMDATLLNAFFVRRDVWVEALPKRTPSEYLQHRMNPLLHIGLAGSPERTKDAGSTDQ